MTCQDCIHHNVCYYAGRLKTKDSDGEKRIIAETNNVEDTCEDFSDRSLWAKLPCRVGDAVWVVYTPKYPANPSDKGKWFMRKDGIQRILLGAKGFSLETWNMGTISAQKIGKTVFFTIEEAEMVLKDRSGK